jgi:hypothetical protein
VKTGLSAGEHELRVELIPNGYNVFGPHHYYLGDTNVVSPDQFFGKRNFADPADAPEFTHVRRCHFRRFELPHSLWLPPHAIGQLLANPVAAEDETVTLAATS